MNNDELDPSIASINIFPSNKIGKFIVKSILLIIPTLNLEFRQTTIISAFENKTYIEYLKFLQDHDIVGNLMKNFLEI